MHVHEIRKYLFDNSKDTSLLCYGIYYGRGKFYCTGPRCVNYPSCSAVTIASNSRQCILASSTPTNVMMGTCYTQSECTANGGTTSGNCASGMSTTPRQLAIMPLCLMTLIVMNLIASVSKMVTGGLYYESFTIVIYDRNDSGRYYKTTITTS